MDTLILTMDTYFISGHLDIEPLEFLDHYAVAIDEAIKQNASFVVGDAPGADLGAQEYLSPRVSANRVTVYHLFDTPRNNYGHFPTRGGFKNDTQRDEAMTKNSMKDIAWFRSPNTARRKLEEQGKKYDPKRKSGTERNIIRRQTAS